MRIHILSITGLSLVAVAVTATYGIPASAQGQEVRATSTGVVHASQASADVIPAMARRACRGDRHRDNDNGRAIVSQQFEDTMDSFDSQGADDFVVARKCVVGAVAVDGLYIQGSGPATSVHVVIYHDDGQGAPGKVVKQCDNLSYFDRTGKGTFYVTLRVGGCAPNGLRLSKGTYWLSVYVSMAFTTGGEWGWLTNDTQRGSASVWKNPSDGFQTGCRTYTATTTCIPKGEGSDFSFAILR